MAIVYEHVFPNGKKYIGITVQKPKKRWQRGKNYTHNPHLQRAINKYGWDNIEHNIIGEYETIEEAGEAEKRLIEEQNLRDPNYGYNILEGGQHWHHSKESIEKMSRMKKGENNPMYGRRGALSPRFGKQGAMLGKHLSEEAKAKISKANMGERNGMHGRKLSDAQKEMIRIRNSGANNKNSIRVLCVETGMVYASSGEASRMTGCNQSHISECCKGIHKITGGYHWRYADG